MKTPVESDILCTPIAVLLDRSPQASRIFIRHRMGCVGCAFARFHTLKDAIEIYQLQEETLLREISDLLGVKDDLGAPRARFEGVKG